ncbi:helix-turn-helix domain-containing protein [Patulibacter sp. NPDC049589]|uniref:TetR/AcrR family transcriptional regulator n=1 Tax=Patulibacter sp. NPDC049589 TaxID=3154731 RepID=UPI003423765E
MPMETTPRRPTQAERRAATRARVLDAAMAGLVDDGYATLTTRAVAERAGVAQSTVMHHFGTREELLSEAMSLIGVRLIEEVLADAQREPRGPLDRAELLDGLWARYKSPAGLAIGNLWIAAWNAPELAGVIRQLEERVTDAIVAAAEHLAPEAADPGLRAFVDGTQAMMRGLVVLVPITGVDDVDARWETIRPLMLRAASGVDAQG